VPPANGRIEGIGGKVELIGEITDPTKLVNVTEIANVTGLLPLILQRRGLPFPVEPFENPLLGKSLRRDAPFAGDVLELLAGNEAHPQLVNLRLPEPLPGPGAFQVVVRSQGGEVGGELGVLDNAIVRRLRGTTMTPRRRGGFQVRAAAQAAKGGKRHERHDNVCISPHKPL
jgi:hypothetical protein